MSCGSDYGASAYLETVRRARKQHDCCACELQIRVGDLYCEITGVWDHRGDRYRQCMRCNALYRALLERRRGTGECVQIDLGCGHDWREIFDADPPPEVARLAFMTADEAQQELAR